MKRFAALLERLAFTPARNAKLALIVAYLRTTPDPDRGHAIAALTGGARLRQVAPRMLRDLVATRVDAELFRLSYDFVGDLAEAIALIWPDSQSGAPADSTAELSLTEAVGTLAITPKAALPERIAGWLDRLGPSERLALLKLATGGLRVGVSLRTVQMALAQYGDRDVAEIAELWHGLSPPYGALFAWLDGGAKPAQAGRVPFRPVMLATAADRDVLAGLSPGDFVAEWKWDGVRVQAVADAGTRRIYTRQGEDISGSFPDLLGALDFDGALDGELLVRAGQGAQAGVAPFSALQKRLGRKRVSAALMAQSPALLRAYDVLVWGGQDMRALPFEARRQRLEAAVAALDPARIDLSPLVEFKDWHRLEALRAAPPDPVIEGVMLKRRDSAYVAGRTKGPWFKWKRDPMVVDAVLLYAQRGHGKRSGFYSDFTFGVWDGAVLVPVGKAYFGFTDAELRALDAFVRANTVERYGPVRAVAPKLVVEVAFEGLNRSARHKSGLAMRFPRIARIRWDKPAAEADRLEALEALLTTGAD